MGFLGCCGAWKESPWMLGTVSWHVSYLKIKSCLNIPQMQFISNILLFHININLIIMFDKFLYFLLLSTWSPHLKCHYFYSFLPSWWSSSLERLPQGFLSTTRWPDINFQWFWSHFHFRSRTTRAWLTRVWGTRWSFSTTRATLPSFRLLICCRRGWEMITNHLQLHTLRRG